jgi:hypothetical protein
LYDVEIFGHKKKASKTRNFMKKHVQHLLVISCALLFNTNCKKSHESQNGPTSTGTFIATIDGTTWKPSSYAARYFPKWHQLYIWANGNNFDLLMGVNIDSINALKKYILESNGDNEATINETHLTEYFSSHDMSDAGGTFELNKFDTSKGILSGSLQFVGYSSNKSKSILLSSTQITDIDIITDTFSYNGNTADCTITGAKTTKWNSKDIYANLLCATDASKKTLEIQVLSLLDQPFGYRFIGFKIPLEQGIGIFPVYSQTSFNNTCQNRTVTTIYKLGNYSYLPDQGNFKITYLDTALKKLKAEYNIIYKDSLKSSTIQFTNGQITINAW